MLWWRKVVPLLACGLLILLLMPALLTGDDVTNVAFGPGGGGALKEGGSVPAQYRSAITQAATKCPELSPSLLAAQLQTESDWRTNETSEANARGMAQFLPETWTTYGVDGNGDGKADIWDPYDAIASMANYDCALVKDTAKVPGDRIDLMLAAYNAGPGAVVKYQGIPPFKQTQQYVPKIKTLAAQLAATPAPPPVGTGIAAVIAWGQQQLGAPYYYGGDCTDPRGPNVTSHCDCSSFVQKAYWHGMGKELPRTTFGQVTIGTAVTMDQLAPGDIIFPDAGHVGMYVGPIPGVGERVVLHAPKTNDVIKYEVISTYWTKGVARRP